MTNSSNLPLNYPAAWPPKLPPLPQTRFSGVPIIGNIVRWVAWQRHAFDHEVKYLVPIEEEIIDQLKTRPTLGGWPGSSVQRRIADVISEAVRQEKYLESPPGLHPDDPFPLLFWGIDDLTPLLVRMGLRKQFQLELPYEDFDRAWEGRWTIRQFIEYCESCIQSHSVA